MKVILKEVTKEGYTNRKKEMETIDEAKKYAGKQWENAEIDETGEVIYVYIDVPKKKKKSNKLEGEFKVIKEMSVCVGCMTWETPALKLEYVETGDIYYWVSEKIEHKELFNVEGKILNMKAFHREGQFGSHLYKVTLI